MGYLSTETPLGATTTYTSSVGMRGTFDTVKGFVFSDTAGTIHIDQGTRDSTGTIFWDVDSSYPVLASDGTGFSEDLVAPLWRIRFIQAGTQTAFRLHASAVAVGYVGG